MSMVFTFSDGDVGKMLLLSDCPASQSNMIHYFCSFQGQQQFVLSSITSDEE
uniref:Uncharacterized protein n=1 Tax=Anguilla anguilla TaxID=7936 RepID=A0A0E9TFW7_ANGAN